KNKAHAAQRMIEQSRIDEISQELVANSQDALALLSNQIPVGNFLFRDYGICPFAGSRCDDGGDIIGNTRVRAPVPNGYLGRQNCLQCRHFVTGPAFLGGLLSISNEISLQAKHQSAQHSELHEQVEALDQQIERLQEAEYKASKEGRSIDKTEQDYLEIQYRRLQSAIESAAMKLDVFLCDLQAATRLIKQCQAL